MERMSNEPQPVLWALGGLALGALAMYLMDPDRGNRRRALIRDQMTHAAVKTRKTFDSQSRNLANRTYGMMYEAQSTLQFGNELSSKGDVMQASQVKNEMPRIQRVIKDAAQQCQQSSNVPEQLRESIGELERESDAAMKTLSGEQNEQRIFDCVAHLEELGDQAKQACTQAGNVDDKVAQAVKQAHDALSDLKHRLH